METSCTPYSQKWKEKNKIIFHNFVRNIISGFFLFNIYLFMIIVIIIFAFFRQIHWQSTMRYVWFRPCATCVWSSNDQRIHHEPWWLVTAHTSQYCGIDFSKFGASNQTPKKADFNRFAKKTKKYDELLMEFNLKKNQVRHTGSRGY